MCQSDQTTDKKRNKLKRAGVWAPVRKRKPDAGPKWYEFKVVPLNRDRRYKSLVRGTSGGQPDYWCDNDRALTKRLNASGMEAYVEFDEKPRNGERTRTVLVATSPTNVCSHSGEQKYFLFPKIYPTKLFH